MDMETAETKHKYIIIIIVAFVFCFHVEPDYEWHEDIFFPHLNNGSSKLAFQHGFTK